MAWFCNYYQCERCGHEWTDEWSCMCDDDCPHCGARHMTPYDSDDLTEIIEKRDGLYVVLRSPDTAGHSPDYYDLAEFTTYQLAEVYLRRP
jgi:predicted  nucleic acid-binding Zn-ribbon protein